MGDYSPWQAEGFAGNGQKTLDSVKELLRGYKTVPAAVCGYSLAGLFALWAFYETGLFKGAVSCSGSLWFEGFMDYLKARTAPENSFVYLSLGGKEEKTDHPVMKTIGDRTRETNKLLLKDPNIVDTTLVMNKGGHFGDAAGRLALGCGWMVEKLYKEIPQDSARTANLLPSPQGKVRPQAQMRSYPIDNCLPGPHQSRRRARSGSALNAHWAFIHYRTSASRPPAGEAK